MKYFVIIIFFLSSISYAQSSSEDLSYEEKRMLIAQLNLSQCVLLGDDFEKILETEDVKNLNRIPDSGTFKRVYDEKANAILYVNKESCIVDVAADEFEKFVSTLPSVLEVRGGKLTLEKQEEKYIGRLKSMGREYSISAYWRVERGQKVLTASISK